MHFWHNSCVLCQILNLLTKFGEDWFNSKEIATVFRNTRWQRQPSWKNTLPIEPPVWERNSWFVTSNKKKLTFVGLSWRLMVVYSWGLQCWSDFRCKSAQSKNGSKFLLFSGRRPHKGEFEGSKPRKGTCTKQNTSFEPSNLRIGPELRPVGKMRKLRKGEQKSQKKHQHFDPFLDFADFQRKSLQHWSPQE